MATDEKLRTEKTINNMVDTRQSPPKAIVDCSPLQPAINRNKEALKIKLMVRRPIAQLVDQGIIPSLKSSPALHEQRKQLERAKTGDILKAKIQRRPDRQELERRHILEHDESHVDPSLAERQRMLKKARLADQLNSQLSHRPGPLELIKKNILHTEEPIERIVKEGLISFKATSEGLLNRPQQPNGYISYEDDSQSSEGDQQNSPAAQDVLEVASTTNGIDAHDFIIPMPTSENNSNTVSSTTVVTHAKLPPSYYSSTIAPPLAPLETFQVKPETSNLFAELCQSVIDSTSTLNFVAPKSTTTIATTSTSLGQPLPPLTTSIHVLPSPVPNTIKSDAPGKDKNRKKNKLKPIAKARTIKFHEYKGPPNAQKNGSTSLSNGETSYQLLLQQQTFLLEHLEGLNENASISAANLKQTPQSETSTFSVSANYLQQAQPSPVPSITSTIPASPISNSSDSNSLELSKLEKMKVSDLKVLLKSRNLPVSGPKTQLIERLRPFIQSNVADDNGNGSIADEVDNSSRNSPPPVDTDNVDMQELPTQSVKIISNDDLVREQQRKIDELTRKLKESRQELQQMQQLKQSQPPPMQSLSTEITLNKPDVLNQKQIFKQQLEAKIQKEKMQKLENLQRLQLEQQQQLEQRKKLENATKVISTETFAPKSTTHFNAEQTNKIGNNFIWNGESTLLLVNFPDDKKYLLSGSPQANTMPNILVPFATAQNMNAIMKKVNLAQFQSSSPAAAPPPPPPPLPINLQLSHHQVALLPKIPSHHQMNVVASDVNKFNNAYRNGMSHEQQSNLSSTSPRLTEVLPNMVNVLVDNVTTATPFGTTSAVVKSENPVFGPATDTITTTSTTNNYNLIPTDIMLSANHMDAVSPMQQSHCDDSCNSFDLFLSEAAQSHSDAVTKQRDQHKDMMVDAVVKKESSNQQPQLLVNDDCTVDLKSFDDIELMELMGQQLDMDISDDSCQTMTGIKNGMKLELEPSKINVNSSSSQQVAMPCRRDMNPSLQPSLSELIQQQQQQHQQTSNHISNNTNSNDNNNNRNSNSNGNMSESNNLIDYNNAFYLGNQSNQATPPNGSMHLGSMDIEYFDNTLAQFDFALPCNQSAMMNNNGSSHCYGGDQQINLLQNTLNTPDCMASMSSFLQTTAAGTCDQMNYYPHSMNSSSNGSSNHGNNILDLFNIDDFKMSADSLAWGEVDYAV